MYSCKGALNLEFDPDRDISIMADCFVIIWSILSFWNSQKMGLGDKVIRRNSLTTLHPMPTQDPQPGLERQKTVPHGFNVCHNSFAVIFYRDMLFGLSVEENSYLLPLLWKLEIDWWLLFLSNNQVNFSPIKNLNVID